MTAIEELRLLTASAIEPALADDELAAILAYAARPDPGGFAPQDEQWTPTYDINAAAARGWLIKAGRAAAIIESGEGGEATSKVFDNCRSMARVYAAKANSTVRI
ncbi:MAG: hypothetical protein KF736_04060 [Acidobacteria bacterium]|nr:hypothetical protein [Acidobacteriota bacterium]MCW5948443.1 hypothetical protein [Pyrinomonadaceae bacterium]